MMLALSLGLALAPASTAQEPLRATVRIVIAPTTVTDRRAAYVDGLTKQDFEVYEDGRPQPFSLDFTYFPISLVVADPNRGRGRPWAIRWPKCGGSVVSSSRW